MQFQPNNTTYKKSIKPVIYIVGLLVFCAIALVSAYFLLPADRILEQKLRAWLLEQGITAEFAVSRLSANRLTIDDIAIAGSDSPTLGSLHATYSLNSLRNRQVNTVRLSDINITILQTADGILEIKGLPQFAAPETSEGRSGFTLPRLPFNTLVAENAQLTFRGKNGESATLTAHMKLHGDYTGELHITEAVVPLDADKLLLNNLWLKRTTPDAPIALLVENIAHITTNKAYFTPLTASGEITLARDYQRINSIMTIQDQRKSWMLNMQANMQLDAGTWNMQFQQPSIQFESGILQPDMLFPVLRGKITHTSGCVSLKGSARKEAHKPIESEGKMTFSDVTATIKDIPVNGVNGSVELSSLYPPATKGNQTVYIGEIVLGLPLKNGQMTFALNKEGKLTFMPSTWEWAKGQLHTTQTSLNIYTPALPDMTLSANGLALEELLSGLLQQGISATGKLSGTLPVHFNKDGEAMIRNGRLATDAGGIVRYQPTQDSPLQKGSSFQTDILLSAMENFHYDVLTMTINSKDSHEMEVLLHVKGRNPELYDGQTIELNINLTGNLLDIVQSGMDVYMLPERLQEQLMQ